MRVIETSIPSTVIVSDDEVHCVWRVIHLLRSVIPHFEDNEALKAAAETLETFYRLTEKGDDPDRALARRLIQEGMWNG